MHIDLDKVNRDAAEAAKDHTKHKPFTRGDLILLIAKAGDLKAQGATPTVCPDCLIEVCKLALRSFNGGSFAEAEPMRDAVGEWLGSEGKRIDALTWRVDTHGIEIERNNESIRELGKKVGALIRALEVKPKMAAVFLDLLNDENETAPGH